MASAVASRTKFWTLADLAEKFGPMPAYRIRLVPLPGTATEQDVIRINDHEDRICELVDGVLVEKTVGWMESFLAASLIRILGNYASRRKLGIVTAPDGMVRLAPRLVRIPDVSFFSWDRLPQGRVPWKSLPSIVPNLAVEVLSPDNTKQEMTRKLADYFKAGVELVWFIDPRKRTVQVFTAAHRFTVLHESAVLDGGSVLPGFSLPLRELFGELDLHAKTKPGRKSRKKGKR